MGFCTGTCARTDMVLQGDGIGNKGPSYLHVKSAKYICESGGKEKKREKQAQLRGVLRQGLSLHVRFHFHQWHPNQLGRQAFRKVCVSVFL